MEKYNKEFQFRANHKNNFVEKYKYRWEINLYTNKNAAYTFLSV